MLELKRLSRRYGDKVALDQLSFHVSPGEVVGFLGPNGAGKTTAMRAILGIVSPDSGLVEWQGRTPDLSTRLRFGYMPEERGLYSTMGVLDQLIYLGRLHGMSKEAATGSAKHWLEMLSIPDRANDRLDALSLGNSQRVQMAAALLHSPELLVLDEPFSGLDPPGIEALSKILAERARDGAAVVFSSHQLDLVEGVCERVIIVNRGRNVMEGSVEELTFSRDLLAVRVAEDPDAEWTRDLAGIHVEKVTSGTAHLRLHEGEQSGAVLDAARRAGTVTHFSYERKHLSEVFRQAVQA